MKRSLYVCNTVYQLFVALWIKNKYDSNTASDIIVSDHTPGGNALAARLKKTSVFENCYFIKSDEYCHTNRKYADHKVKEKRKAFLQHPEDYLKTVTETTDSNGIMTELSFDYDCLYLSNMDNFGQLLTTCLLKNNRKCRFYLFEDGFSSYSEIWETYYNRDPIPNLEPYKKAIYEHVFHIVPFQRIVTGFFLFNPNLLEWTPDCKIVQMDRINSNDKGFIDTLNTVFNYDGKPVHYTQDFIFFEESFNNDGFPVNDIDVIESLANIVGKDSIIVKTHPRSKENRFSPRGFQTMQQTTMPWEVIMLNNPDLANKVFVTICSGAAINPALIFGMPIHVCSIYNLLSNDSRDNHLLNGTLWRFAKLIFQSYPDSFSISNTIEEIVSQH